MIWILFILFILFFECEIQWSGKTQIFKLTWRSLFSCTRDGCWITFEWDDKVKTKQ